MDALYNKVNISLGLPELTMEEAMTEYYKHYIPKAVKDNENRKKFVFIELFYL